MELQPATESKDDLRKFVLVIFMEPLKQFVIPFISKQDKTLFQGYLSISRHVCIFDAGMLAQESGDCQIRLRKAAIFELLCAWHVRRLVSRDNHVDPLVGNRFAHISGCIWQFLFIDLTSLNTRCIVSVMIV